MRRDRHDPGSHATVFERLRPPEGVVRQSLEGSRQVPFWLDDVADATHRHPELIGDATADLVVVGGGYCGLWTALLAKREDPSSRVVLIESHTLGWAASGRNGGFCDASLTHGHENGASRWPEEIDLLDRLGMRNLDEIEAEVAELGLDCHFERNGGLSVAIEPHQVDWLTGEVADADAVMGEVELLDQEAIRAQVASPTYLAGVWAKRSTALLHPARLVQELGRVASEMGVEIFEHTRAESLDAGATGPVTVRTGLGRLTAGRVALATNVFPSLLRRYRYHTVPVYDYALMTEPLTGEQLDSIGWRHRQGLSDLANQFHYYRMSRDNRILFGGYDAIYRAGGRVRAEYEDRAASYERLASHFFTTFPQLEDVRFSHRWAGAVDTSTRFCAFFGRGYRGRVAHAAGFTGLGVASTHFAALVLLDLLAGRTTQRTELAMVREPPLPFPPEPLASLGIQATRWSLDRADHRAGRRNLLLKALDKAGLGFDS